MTSLADIGNNIIHADLSPAGHALGKIAVTGFKVFAVTTAIILAMLAVHWVWHNIDKTLIFICWCAGVVGIIATAASYVGINYGSGYASTMAGTAGLVLCVIGMVQQTRQKAI